VGAGSWLGTIRCGIWVYISSAQEIVILSQFTLTYDEYASSLLECAHIAIERGLGCVIFTSYMIPSTEKATLWSAHKMINFGSATNKYTTLYSSSRLTI